MSVEHLAFGGETSGSYVVHHSIRSHFQLLDWFYFWQQRCFIVSFDNDLGVLYDLGVLWLSFCIR